MSACVCMNYIHNLSNWVVDVVVAISSCHDNYNIHHLPSRSKRRAWWRHDDTPHAMPSTDPSSGLSRRKMQQDRDARHLGSGVWSFRKGMHHQVDPNMSLHSHLRFLGSCSSWGHSRWTKLHEYFQVEGRLFEICPDSCGKSRWIMGLPSRNVIQLNQSLKS